jgi:hypothetical protein
VRIRTDDQGAFYASPRSRCDCRGTRRVSPRVRGVLPRALSPFQATGSASLRVREASLGAGGDARRKRGAFRGARAVSLRTQGASRGTRAARRGSRGRAVPSRPRGNECVGSGSERATTRPAHVGMRKELLEMPHEESGTSRAATRLGRPRGQYRDAGSRRAGGTAGSPQKAIERVQSSSATAASRAIGLGSCSLQSS